VSAVRPGALELSPREREVVHLLCEGFTDREIAASLYLSQHTVQTHVRRILYVLRARNRTHAATLWTRQLA
jgi:DNA-binding CsgD family transcriptional regulator